MLVYGVLYEIRTWILRVEFLSSIQEELTVKPLVLPIVVSNNIRSHSLVKAPGAIPY